MVLRILWPMLAIAACGSVPESRIDQDFYGRWSGTAEVQTNSGLMFTMPMDLGVSVGPSEAYVENLCPRGHSVATAHGEGGTIELTSSTVCEEAPVGACDKAVITYTYGALLLVSREQVHGTFSGLLSGCGAVDVGFISIVDATRQ